MAGPVSEHEFLASYDPRAYDPIAVTVDVVALTIRDGGLHVLLVQRGVPPACRASGRCLAVSCGPIRCRGPSRRTCRGSSQGTGRRDRRASREGAPRTARHLRRARSGPADAGDLGRLPGLRPGAARAAGRQRRRRRRLGGRRLARPDGRRQRPAPGHHSQARLRPRQDPGRRPRAGAVQARVHPAGHLVRDGALHDLRAARWSTRPCGASRYTPATSTARSCRCPASSRAPATTTETGGPRGGPRARLYRRGDAAAAASGAAAARPGRRRCAEMTAPASGPP